MRCSADAQERNCEKRWLCERVVRKRSVGMKQPMSSRNNLRTRTYGVRSASSRDGFKGDSLVDKASGFLQAVLGACWQGGPEILSSGS